MDFLISEYHRTMLEKKEIIESSLGGLIKKRHKSSMKLPKSRREKLEKFHEARFKITSAM